MKILIYNWRDIKNPMAGGAETYTHEIAKRLTSKGHEITWFTAAFPRCKNEEKLDGVRIVRSGSALSVYRQVRICYDRRFKDQFDVVIDEINTRPFMTYRYVDVPIVALIHQLAREFWFHATPFPVSVLGYCYLEKHWLRPYRNMPTITVSESTKQDLERLGFEDVTVVLNGFDVPPIESSPKKEDDPTLLFVGRMTKTKRPEHAIRAFSYVRRQMPSAQLWMIGDGPLLNRLRTRWRLPGVEFFGRVSETQKYELMRSAHVILVPSIREGWGRIVTEANLQGTPAIGYNVHGLRDSIRDGETGYLCQPDPAQMGEVSIRLLRDTDDQHRLARAALVWAKELTWDRSAQQIEQRLLEVSGVT